MKKITLRFLASAFAALAPAMFAATIPNPSFETDNFTVFPGYISGNSVITGWTANNPNRVGINPGGGSPFANNGTIPAGNNVAFIQSAESETPEGVTLSTTLSALTVGTTYRVSFRVNARNGAGTGSPNLSVEIGTNIINATLGGVGGAAPYNFFAVDFTATATSQTLTLRNNAAGDTTALVDDFSIAARNSGWSFDAWNDDATSGVDGSKHYTHAFSFGTTVGTTINGIDFTAIPGGNPAGSTFSTAGLPNVFANDGNNVIEGSGQLANDFIYAGANTDESITINGLITGGDYVATIYSVGFDAPLPDGRVFNRAATFSVGSDRLTVNQTHFGNDNGIRISYHFVATSNSITLTYTRLESGSIHTYGFSNKELSVPNSAAIGLQPASQTVGAGEDVTFTVTAAGSAPLFYQWRKNTLPISGQNGPSLTLSAVSTNDNGVYSVIVSNSVNAVTSSNATLVVGLAIANRSFEADTFTVFPGYVSGNGPITGWNALGGHGINPGPSSPFADNGTIPHGLQVAFMQEDGPLSQVISGFTVGDQYYVVYDENARSGNVPSLEVKIGDTTIVPAHTRGSVGANPYVKVTSAAFVASSDSLELTFIKSNPLGGDNTVLIDNVLILPLPAGTRPTISQPANQIANEGDPVTFDVTVFGSQPLSYQWSKNGVAIMGQTNRALVFPSVVECDSGDYSVFVSNSAGQTSSIPASLLIAFRNIPAGVIYGTGLNADYSLADNGTVDLHYILGQSVDTGFPGPSAFVVNDTGFPIPPWLASGPKSKWIAPQADQSGGNLPGTYVYQTFFDLTGVDLSKFQISGKWSVDNGGNDILINGVSTGNANTAGFTSFTPFVITKGFVQGMNTLDFVMNNADAVPPTGLPGPTGLRVDLAGLVDLRPTLTVTPGGISWGNTCHRLQSAPSITGPWTTIAGAANPYPVNKTSPQMQFFRVAP